MNKKNVPDLIDKASRITEIIMRMAGKDGTATAINMIKKGKAEQKLREIIYEQGGKPKVKPEEVVIGDKIGYINSTKSGRVSWISNESIARIAKAAGAPKTKGAGVILNKKLGEAVKKDDVLLEIYAERSSKLNTALELAKNLEPIVLSKKIREQILLEKIPEKFSLEKPFMLER